MSCGRALSPPAASFTREARLLADGGTSRTCEDLEWAGGPAFGRTAGGEKGEMALVPPGEDRHAGGCKATSGLRKGTPTGGREQPQAIEGGEKGRESWRSSEQFGPTDAIAVLGQGVPQRRQVLRGSGPARFRARRPSEVLRD